MKPRRIPEFVDSLQTRGRYTFTRLEAVRVTGESDSALKLSLWRLQKKGRIRLVREGFYVIIPLEYASSGVLPPEWFVADLMEFLERPYYVALLSAAAIHGAAHLQPQEFQVMVPTPLRVLRAGDVSIRFFARSRLASSSIVEVKTPTGHMRVSDPGVTAVDLVAYASRVGGLNRVFTILQELSEKLTSRMLVVAARGERRLAYLQRLGWLLSRTGREDLVRDLAAYVAARDPREVPLDPASSRRGFRRDPRWMIVQNADVESEL